MYLSKDVLCEVEWLMEQRTELSESDLGAYSVWPVHGTFLETGEKRCFSPLPSWKAVTKQGFQRDQCLPSPSTMGDNTHQSTVSWNWAAVIPR